MQSDSLLQKFTWATQNTLAGCRLSTSYLEERTSLNNIYEFSPTSDKTYHKC
jgi:hypothetical protein